MSRAARLHDHQTIARTIRFPAGLRDRIAADAVRCDRSFEGQVIAVLRRQYGEDVDIAPASTEVLALARASLAGVAPADLDLPSAGSPNRNPGMTDEPTLLDTDTLSELSPGHLKLPPVDWTRRSSRSRRSLRRGPPV